MNFRSFEEFWSFYVNQHSKQSTRRWHFAGTLMGDQEAWKEASFAGLLRFLYGDFGVPVCVSDSVEQYVKLITEATSLGLTDIADCGQVGDTYDAYSSAICMIRVSLTDSLPISQFGVKMSFLSVDFCFYLEIGEER
ncbi:hypothetical protein NE237_010235 [Protea cynaroides]|uniref:Uncharacterized protein n=1 Tax=Protea cynaroides TaxID=273540 RepID=A0A9Q0R1H3_9MAGN|nr:hypothetical protein NE237_010235 [Protea cynaroides]